MDNAIFITGTDTAVGKTVITGLLGRFLIDRGMDVVTQKWVQTGSSRFAGDITRHMELMGMSEEKMREYRSHMEPYVLKFASSPHLAASLEGARIDPARIEDSFLRLKERFDLVLVEGSGGLMVPVNEEKFIVDIAAKLGMKVLIVSSNKLGAINQTLLTAEALKRRNVSILGIVFNRLSDETEEVILRDNMDIIARLTGEEVLGELKYNREGAPEAFYRDFLPIGERILKRIKES